MAHIEIIPDEMGGFEIYGRRYEVSPATDVIMRFVDPEYDYLHYLDPEEHAITMHWLGQTALMSLASYGIPETRKRLKMPNCVHEQYLDWMANIAMGVFEQDLAELPDSDDIDKFFGNPEA